MEQTFLALIFVFFIGNLVGSAIGFGSGIITVTLSALFMPLELIIPILVPLNIVLCTYLVARHSDGVNIRLLVVTIIPLSTIGLFIGMGIFKTVNVDNLRSAFGFFVFCISVVELWKMRSSVSSEIKPMGKLGTFMWLLAGGIVQGLWISGGPLVAYWASRSIDNKREFRSTLAALWLILNIFLFIGYFSTSNINSDTALISLKLLPVICVGIVIGEKIHKKLPEKTFKVIVYCLLLFAGFAVMVR